MQWLIDLIKEWVQDQGYLTHSFVDRGDPASADWTEATLTVDGNWNELDISSIVPATAKAVLFSCIIRDDAASTICGFRKSGNVNFWNVSQMFTQVANVFYQQDICVAGSTNQKIEYNIGAGMDTVYLTVRGWWL